MTQKTAAHNELNQRFIAFSLAQQHYAIPLLHVKEVIGMTEITPVPGTPPYFKGMMNLRGQVISVIDLRTKLRVSATKDLEECSIIILDLAPLHLGMIVDSINSVMTFMEQDLSPPPNTDSTTPNAYLSGVAKKEGRLILLLDIPSILNVEDMKTLRQQQKQQAA